MLPMRVIPGKKMPGHMGAEQVTVQNLEVIQVDLENNCLLIKGNVPGPKKALVFIKTAIKNQDKVNEKIDLITYVDETKEVETPETAEEVVEEVTEEVADNNTEETASQTEEE